MATPPNSGYITLFGGKVGRIMPKYYDESTKSKAVRLVVEHRDEYESEYACIRVVAGRIGVGPETLRKWVRQAEIDGGDRDGTGWSAMRTNAMCSRCWELWLRFRSLSPEATVKACGVAVAISQGHSWAPTSSSGQQ